MAANARRYLRACVVVLVAASLASCATRRPAPIEERAARPAPSPLPAPIVSPAPPAAPPAAVAPAPEPDWRPPTYTVKRGDTLYAIALDHGLDYRELAAWNGIENVNLIRVGQVLALSAPGQAAPAGSAGVTTAPLRTVPPVVAQGSQAASAAAPAVAPALAPPPGPRNSDTYKAQPKVFKAPYSENAWREAQRGAAAPASPSVPAETPAVVARIDPKPDARPEPKIEAKPEARPESKADVKPEAESRATPPPADDDKIQWSWPATGKILTTFSETANLKGIDIGGQAGTPVLASAAGKVVYAGSGLRGYGKLIIVKHSATFLSAYAHNRELLVKEGQQVARGQKIAEMGNTDTSDVKLHFEIRRQGKPVDPLKYLPPA